MRGEEPGQIVKPQKRVQEAETSTLLLIPRCKTETCRRRGLIGRGQRDGSVAWYCTDCFSTELVREERA